MEAGKEEKAVRMKISKEKIKKEKIKKGKITESVGFKVFLFLVLALSVLITELSAIAMAWMVNVGAYTESYENYLKEMLGREVASHSDYICYDRTSFPTLVSVEQALELEEQYNNLSFSITRMRDDILYFKSAEMGKGEGLVFQKYFYRATYYTLGTYQDEQYLLTISVDTAFPKEDSLKSIAERAVGLYRYRNVWPTAAAGGLLLVIVSFVWLLCSAGHRRGQEGITPSVLSNLYLDLLTVFFGFGAFVILGFTAMLYDGMGRGSEPVLAFFLALGGMLETVWWTLYLREFALRMKMGKWWKHSLCYTLLRLIGRAVRFLGRGLTALIRGIPGIIHVVAMLMVLTLCEFVGILRWGEAELFACWVFEKLLVVPVILYCALAFEKLRKGSRALARGELSHKLDTKYLVLEFKDQGDNLNRIGEGISKAVEERLQSERLKTELITNVSHDLKTPLTSIINYADLLGSVAEGEEAKREEQIKEYSEVLLRQSGRLKKLLEDLVDISKASTGNLEVVAAPCELGVLLTQVAGEYESRLEEKGLVLHVAKPEEEVRILADGRHLWRVFDNLMNNICKYAQEGSRVYLNMELSGEQVQIIFRNMSKYELNISPQELEERFVRGDASRHMEGSGLGLSIAKSLVELQQGSMEIVTDGDLFKVILKFNILH